MIQSRGRFVLIILSLVLIPFSGRSKEIPITNEPTSQAATNQPQFNLRQKIQEGIELLKKSAPLKYEYKIIAVKRKKQIRISELARKQISLAILNKQTGRVIEKRVWVKEQEIKDYGKTGLINLTPDKPNEQLDIQTRWWNSFNTYYQTSDPDQIVIANKYLLASGLLTTLPERSRSKYSEIVYTPYSEYLHTNELISAGRDYINQKVETAFDQLDFARIRSVSTPGGMVASSISKDFVKNIILVEHVDPDSFNLADDGGKELTERVLALIGANQERAYRYTGSPAGANGLAQFIRPTYNTIVSRYPKAHLIKDYNLGMADHVNAIKAMVLFFDNYKKEIADKVTRAEVLSQLGINEEMLAAAYNGGPKKVARSINTLGLAWISGQLTPQVNPAKGGAKKIFKKETLTYVKKFRAIRDLSLF